MTADVHTSLRRRETDRDTLYPITDKDGIAARDAALARDILDSHDERMAAGWKALEQDVKAFPMTGQGALTGIFGEEPPTFRARVRAWLKSWGPL